MSDITNEQSFTLATESKLPITFSVYQSSSSEPLLFIHSDFISSQWPLNSIGIMVLHQSCNVKLSIMPNNTIAHQSWFIDKTEFDELVAYFKGLGFPVHTPDPLGANNPTGFEH